jgi:hypothetical protein
VFCGGYFSNPAFLTILPLKIDNAFLTGTAGEFLTLQFSALPDRTYTVQSRAQIDSAAWSDVSSVAAQPSNRVVWVTNTITGGTGSGFFRLSVSRQQ